MPQGRNSTFYLEIVLIHCLPDRGRNTCWSSLGIKGLKSLFLSFFIEIFFNSRGKKANIPHALIFLFLSGYIIHIFLSFAQRDGIVRISNIE